MVRTRTLVILTQHPREETLRRGNQDGATSQLTLYASMLHIHVYTLGTKRCASAQNSSNDSENTRISGHTSCLLCEAPASASHGSSIFFPGHGCLQQKAAVFAFQGTIVCTKGQQYLPNYCQFQMVNGVRLLSTASFRVIA